MNIQTGPDAESGGVFARFWDTGEVQAFPSTFRPGFLLPTDRPDVLLWGADKHLSLTDLASGPLRGWRPSRTGTTGPSSTTRR
ncbi:MAG: hypothetical protein U0871_18380 [Gemmataceae bacterium]